jgi:hypothetical protein
LKDREIKRQKGIIQINRLIEGQTDRQRERQGERQRDKGRNRERGREGSEINPCISFQNAPQ